MIGPRSVSNFASISNRQPITPSRINRTEPNPSLLFNHDSFTVAEVAWLVDELVTARSEKALRVARQSVGLVNKFIRQPLVMNSGRIDRLLDVHVVIDYVRDYIEDCINYCWPTGT